MKKLIAMMMLLLSMQVMGQKIQKNETDKFTGLHVIETKMETMFASSGWAKLIPDHYKVKIGVRKVDDEWVLPAKINFNNCEKITEGDGLVLLLDNNETVRLTTAYTGICKPEGAWYSFSTVLHVNPEDWDKLRTRRVTDVRVLVMGHNYDFTIKGKNQDLLQRMIRKIEAIK